MADDELEIDTADPAEWPADPEEWPESLMIQDIDDDGRAVYVRVLTKGADADE